VAYFEVDDIEAVVRDLTSRGVVFDGYDTPKTVNFIAHIGPARGAWFKDPDGNMFGVPEGPVPGVSQVAPRHTGQRWHRGPRNRRTGFNSHLRHQRRHRSRLRTPIQQLHRLLAPAESRARWARIFSLPHAESHRMEPSLRYARTSDGVAIAYTLTGEGPPLVWLPPVPLSNVFGQWRVPRFRDAYERLGEHVRLLIYDGRGTGHSQRDADDFSLEAMLRDLDAVVDHAAIETFALLGYYSSAVTAIAYAARHPDRVTRLILFGGAMRLHDAISPPESQALVTLIDRDWDLFVDSAARAWMGWSIGAEGRLVADAFRSATTPANARAMIEAAREMNVSAEVGSVHVPSLVVHRQGEREIPVEVSEQLAQTLPDGRLLRLEGSSAGLFFEDPEADIAVLLDFLTGESGGAAAAASSAPWSISGESLRRGARGVFISCSERQKGALGRPFKALLDANGVRGFIVSDEPRPEAVWTPEEKVDAYLDLSDAVVVFATADLEAGEDRYTRPNIGDEIGRARSKPHLRNRICVLKEHGVVLPSNINPAYESFEVADPEEGFQRALAQLRAWKLLADPLSASPPTATGS
jgi:pimeloyl-ACP methyl ester carboxylesterase